MLSSSFPLIARCWRVSEPRAFPVVQRGEIWQVDWSPGRGSEQAGVRPCLSVQRDAGNQARADPNTIVAALSTSGREIPLHVRISPSATNGLKALSYVKCEQLTTISKTRLMGKPWGRLSEAEMAAVDRALLLSLGLR
jgi:mRNA interferase MazF